MKKLNTIKMFALLFTTALVIGSGGCGETDPKGDTAKESVDTYVDKLSNAPDTARRVVKTVEDKQADYLEDVPMD